MLAWYHAACGAAALAGAALLLSSFGCGGTSPLPASQSTARTLSAPATSRTAVPLRAEWLSLSALSSLPTASDAPYPALGHLNGHFTAVVRVSERALSDYRALGPDRDLPPGSVVAQFLTDASGSAGSVFVMRKNTEKGWQYAVLRPDGSVIDWGALPLCQRCHGEASRGHLFGLPRD
jgi:hypothetical protein